MTYIYTSPPTAINDSLKIKNKLFDFTVSNESYADPQIVGTSKDYSDYGVYTKNYTHGKVDGICQFISSNNIIETKYFNISTLRIQCILFKIRK